MRRIKTTLQKVATKKRISVLIVALVFAIPSIITLIPLTPPAAAWDTTAPDTGVMRLRIGKDGRTTRIPLRAYYKTQYTNPTITFTQAAIDYAGEDEHSCAGNTAANIRVVGSTGAVLAQWDCDEDDAPFHDSPKTVTLQTPQPAPGLPGWFVTNAFIELVDNSGNPPSPSCEGSKNSNADEDGDDGCVDYKFTARLNNGADSRLTMDRSTNANGYTLWGAGSYTVPFGPDPSACGQSTVSGKIGLIDPDGDSMSLRLEHFRGGQWVDIDGVNIGRGSGEFSKNYNNFVPGERYRLRLTGINEGNTAVILFPFPTIYGEVAVNCWNIRTTTTVSTNTVTIDPENPSPTTVTWTHTADNQGVVNTAPVNLSYRWSTAAPSGAPNPPAAPWNNVVITPNGNRVRTSTVTIPASTPPGTQYCQGMRSSRTSFNNSAPTPWTNTCVTVRWPQSSPYFRVFYGDVNSTSGSIRAWHPNNNSIGAGGQLAALARGTINGFPTANATAPAAKLLSFANSGAGNPGNFTSGYTWNIGSGTATGAKHINGGPTGPNRTDVGINYTGTRVIETYGSGANGDIYIWNNIQASQLFDLKDTPMAKIIARRDIYISSEVSRLDAILFAGRDIYTCAVPSGGVLGKPSMMQIADAGVSPVFAPQFCRKNQLTVNGAVSAKRHLYLLRSNFGIEKGKSATEIVNFVPTAWIQALTGTAGPGGGATYDAYTSLPPIL